MNRLKKFSISLLATLLLLSQITTTASAAQPSTNYSLSGNEANDIVAVAVAQSKVSGLSGSDFGFGDDPWCGLFISWCAKKANVSCVPGSITGGRSSIANIVDRELGEFYCYDDAKTHTKDSYNNWSIFKYVSSHPKYKVSNTGNKHIHEVSRSDFKPLKGDIVVFLRRDDYTHPQFSHVGLVREDYSGKGAVLTVEGNTTKQYTVACQERSVSQGTYMQIVGFVRPNYGGASSSTPATGPSSTPSSSISVKTDKYYTIKNLGSGKMLNVFGSESADKTNVSVYHEDKTSGQDFKFISNGSGGYVLEPRCATKSALNVYGTSSQSDSNVTIWRKTGNPTQSWIIEYNSSQKGYVIRSADNTSYVLTAKGKDDSSDVRLAPYDSSSKYQIWTSAAFSANTNSNNTPPSSTKNDVSLRFAKDSCSVNTGEQIRIDFTFTGDILKAVCDVTDRSKCEIIGGKYNRENHTGYLTVKGLTEGTCNIQLWLHNKEGIAASGQVPVQIKKSASTPTQITLSPASISLDLSRKKSQEVTVTVGGNLPKGCYLDSSMSNPSIATVDWSRCDPGTVFHPTITAKAAGETMLTCSVKSGDSVLATANLKITVAAPAAPSTYTVKYDANGGKNAPASQTKTAQQALTLSREFPTRDGYTFAGWATTKDGSAQYQPGEQYTADKDVTLYAVWKKTENKVSLTLAKTSLDIKVGDQAAIDFTFDGTVDSISYQIDDESICKYVDGEWKYSQHKGTLTVKAMSSGTTSVTIVLYDENDNVLASRTATITVSGRTPSVEEAPVTMTLYPYIDEVVPGSKVRLNFTFTGEVEGMFFDIADQSVFTDRGGELNFDQHSGYYEFEALSPGTTDITIILYEGEGANYKVLASETASVTVKKSVAFYPSNPTPDYGPIILPSITLDQSSIWLTVGGAGKKLTVTTTPAGQNVMYSSSDPNVAIAAIDVNGGGYSIEPVGPGTATITATMAYNGQEYTSSCSVTVLEIVPLDATLYTSP